MRILYGVVGEGMGHATRSKVVLTHLAARGHEVKVIVSGRAHAYLKRFFPDVVEITGLRMSYKENAVKRGATFEKFLDDIVIGRGAAKNLAVLRKVHGSFDPDVVVSDFESAAYLYGKTYRKPVFSIDNMQVLNRCEIDAEIPAEERTSFTLAKTIVKAKLPGCSHYLVTTFFFPPVRKERTTLFPPILRDEIIAAKARAALGEHVLVYQTSDSLKALVPTLEKMKGHRFVVYGLKRDEDRGNVRLKDFSEDGFVQDLASAGAVITGGGFSLMSEAVYLGKPILSVPIKKQFEQTLNAIYLEKLGYGAWATEFTPDAIAGFLERREELAAGVAKHRQDGNRLILEKLDELLAQVGN
jgi:uncharacterized protein (TIGR00661 family)